MKYSAIEIRADLTKVVLQERLLASRLHNQIARYNRDWRTTLEDAINEDLHLVKLRGRMKLSSVISAI